MRRDLKLEVIAFSKTCDRVISRTPQCSSRSMTPLTQVVSPRDIPEWDQIVGRFPKASFFHSAAWADVLQQSYGFRPQYFVRGPLDSPSAILPVMEVASFLTGKRGVSLPFSDQCDPLSRDPVEAHALWKDALAHAKRLSWKYLEVRGPLTDFCEGKVATEFYGHTLDLSGSEQTLSRNVDSSVRRAVRKAEQAGLTTEVSHSSEATRIFYRLLGKTRRRHGVPVQPFSFFREIHRAIISQGKGCIVLAKSGLVPVAGAMFFNFGHTAVYKYGGSDPYYQHLRGNNLVMWKAILWHAQNGYERLDFGRTSHDNAGLRSFKLGWGAQENSIAYMRFDCQKSSWLAAPDTSSGRLSPLFKRIPLSVSRLVGALAYRHIA